MKILVIGSGGREHALAWKLAQWYPWTSVYQGRWRWCRMRSHGQHAAGYQDRMKCASTALSLVQFPLRLFLDVPTAQLEALLRCGHPLGDQT